MAGTQAVIVHQFFDNNGDPASGYSLYSYETGTTTPLDTYSDDDLTTPNTNPIVLDSAGRATIYLAASPQYKFVLKDTDGTTIWTRDPIAQVPLPQTGADVQASVGEDIAAGEVVFCSSGGAGTDGLWYKADADYAYASSNAKAIGIATEAITTVGSGGSGVGNVRIAGRVSGLSGLTAGTTYYVSATAGALTSSAPAVTYRRPLGVADSTTSLVLSAPIGAASWNLYTPPTVGVGAARLGGVIASDSATVALAASAGDQDLYTHTILAGTLGTNGDALRITMPLSFAANGNTKTVKVFLGATAATVVNAAVNGTSGILTAIVRRTSDAGQTIYATVAHGTNATATGSYASSATPAETLANAIVVKVTGASGSSAASDVVAYGWTVEFLPA